MHWAGNRIGWPDAFVCSDGKLSNCDSISNGRDSTWALRVVAVLGARIVLARGVCAGPFGSQFHRFTLRAGLNRSGTSAGLWTAQGGNYPVTEPTRVPVGNRTACRATGMPAAFMMVL